MITWGLAALSGGLLTVVLTGGIRCHWRSRLDRRLDRPAIDQPDGPAGRPASEGRQPLLVFGAGAGGSQVVTAMLRDPRSPYFPVALLDDDRAEQRLRPLGVPVRGGRAQIAAAAERHAATTLLIAIPSASGALVGELTDIANDAGLSVLVLPPTAELIGGQAGVTDIRPLTESDLLGRHAIDIDVGAIAGYLTGRRVLVTGAGGAIGSELCRQIARFAPGELLMLDRDESRLQAVQLAIKGRAVPDGTDLVLFDIRDRYGLERLFADRRPEVVFHAAALQHLPLLERHPGEGVWTNVLATLDLLEISARCGVKRFVNVSTDKAADPISVLGYTKRVAERLTAYVAGRAEGVYLSVRFGNVLSGRGSILTAFRAQLEGGGPLTVTHPDVTRYFMTVEEAVRLVIQAGAIARPGEALVLDMGTPVRIAAVAERLALQSDRPMEVVYTGLRPGEKLHETLLGRDEPDVRPIHPLVSHVYVPPCDPLMARRLDPDDAPEDMLPLLRQLAGVSKVDGQPRIPEPRAAFN